MSAWTRTITWWWWRPIARAKERGTDATSGLALINRIPRGGGLRGRLALAAALVAVPLLGGCGGSGADGGNAATVPQPPLAELPGFVRSQLAPQSRRVDLREPSFSHPTQVTN